MEDHFLYKLRNGQLQNNRGNYKSKKVVEYKKDGNMNSDSQKQLGKLLEKVLDFQKDTLACLEKIALFQNKESEAMVKIADTLKALNETALRKKKDKKLYTTSLFSVNPAPTRNDSDAILNVRKIAIHGKGLSLAAEKMLFKTVKSMRGNNQTWSAIADYLKKENIPTLTGNGTWSPNLVLYFYKKILSRSLAT